MKLIKECNEESEEKLRGSCRNCNSLWEEFSEHLKIIHREYGKTTIYAVVKCPLCGFNGVDFFGVHDE